MYGRKARGKAAQLLPLAAALGLCLCHARAQSGPAAKVTALAGQVSVLRDNSPWALKVGDPVQPRQIIVTGPDGAAQFQVSDGSTFQVFPNSRVVFRENPSDWTQLLDLFIGRVKVEIQKLGRQPNPNTVRTPTAVISVRGTIFDVEVEEDAETTVVSVDEGLVEVSNLTVPGGRSKLLNPGESLRVIKDVPLAKTIDKGAVAERAVRAAAQAMYEIIFRTPRPGGGASGSVPGGTGPIGQGDRDKPAPPAEAPPPAPPPPPPPPQQ